MNAVRLEPDKLSRVFQLVGAWLVAVVLLAGLFVGAVKAINDPAWLRAVMALSLLPLVVGGLSGAFLLMTKFRPELQDDKYYSAYRRWQERVFRGYESETKQLKVDVAETATMPLDADFDAPRKHRYEANGGIFLVHSWRPSTTEGQVADVVIRLVQHLEGPLSQGQVKNVEYNLGPKFSDQPMTEDDSKTGFSLNVSAYGPALCLARVHFTDGRPPLALERYIDFPTDIAD